MCMVSRSLGPGVEREFFIWSNSFAAPFFSDESTGYVTAGSAEEALERFAAKYRHPAGLYSANCYGSADVYHKGGKPLAQWLCNHERVKQEATKGLGVYSYYGEGPGRFRIGDKWFDVPEPKKGGVVGKEIS
jgi:hypothetical protein